MKRNLFVFVGIFALAIPNAIVFANDKNVEEASAYSYQTPSKLPTTIDLNDASDEVIRSYYADASGYHGDELLIHLKEILKKDQIYYSYNHNTCIWQVYEISDRDWDKSPASAIPSYNAETNTIQNYQYAVSSRDPYIHALYVNRNVDNKSTAMGDHTSKNLDWGTNQEHIWAKSQGYDANGQGGARGDLMNLQSGNGRVNQTEHNNYYYGYVDKAKPYTTPDVADPTKYAHLSGNYLGSSKTHPESNVNVFEPQDSDKGDIARAIFYMVARYNYLSGEDSDGIDTNNPNLELTEDLSFYSDGGYTSSTTTTGKMGLISDLLEWNKLDPVDQYEMHRNNLLYNNYTNNRNPFIDFPQWADIIWGGADGVADPENDSINDRGYITPSKEEIEVYTNNTAKISATTSDDSEVFWSIADTTVATLDYYRCESGYELTLTPLKVGTTTITVTAEIKGWDEEIEIPVTVLEEELSKIEVSAPKTSYTKDQAFVKPTVIAIYNSGRRQVVTNEATFSGFNSSTLGKHTITVTYGGKETSYDITVTDGVAIPVSLAISEAKTEYFVDEDIYEDDFVTTVTYSNDDEIEVVPTNVIFPDMSTVGAKTVTVEYEEGGVKVENSFEINVYPRLEYISISNEVKTFNVGDEFVKPTVKAYYNDGTNSDVSSSASISGYDMDSAGSQTVTVTYSERNITKYVTYTITVNEIPDPVPTSLRVASPKVEYNVGDEFVAPSVYLVYDDGHEELLSSGLSFSGYDLSKAGEQTVTVSYSQDDVSLSKTYIITVIETKKAGCFGSVTATSVILSSLALVGIALLIYKKKKVRL